MGGGVAAIVGAAMNVTAAVYVVLMAAVIVGVDVLYLPRSVLGTADRERRHCRVVRGVLPARPEASLDHAGCWRSTPSGEVHAAVTRCG